MHDADYRKHNDRSHNSSTYHKKDGTSVRSILKQEANEEIGDWDVPQFDDDWDDDPYDYEPWDESYDYEPEPWGDDCYETDLP